MGILSSLGLYRPQKFFEQGNALCQPYLVAMQFWNTSQSEKVIKWIFVEITES